MKTKGVAPVEVQLCIPYLQYFLIQAMYFYAVLYLSPSPFLYLTLSLCKLVLPSLETTLILWIQKVEDFFSGFTLNLRNRKGKE